jgi:hypothetical protein
VNPDARRGRERPPRGARRFGYVVAAAVNVVLLVLIHVRPGWQAVRFLTEQTVDVLPWVTAQLVASVGVNAVWFVADPRWLRALGELGTSVVGLVATARVLQVFPFAFDAGSVWPDVVRVVLWVAVVGSAIGVLANVVRFVRAVGSDGAGR